MDANDLSCAWEVLLRKGQTPLNLAKEERLDIGGKRRGRERVRRGRWVVEEGRGSQRPIDPFLFLSTQSPVFCLLLLDPCPLDILILTGNHYLNHTIMLYPDQSSSSSPSHCEARSRKPVSSGVKLVIQSHLIHFSSPPRGRYNLFAHQVTMSLDQ